MCTSLKTLCAVIDGALAIECCWFPFRAEYDLFQIELSKNYGTNEWREDLKKVMMKAGLDNNSMVFLFSDTQVDTFFLNLKNKKPCKFQNCPDNTFPLTFGSLP